jgi:hypothetical protein
MKKQGNEILIKIFDNLSSGLLYTYARINDNTKKTLEAASFLYALIELPHEKGILTIEGLDERKRQVAERLVGNATPIQVVNKIYKERVYKKWLKE